MNDILETLRKMMGTRAYYDIGDWWNAVDLAIDELDKLKRIIEDREDEIGRLRHELADAHGVAQACERRAELAEAEIIKLKS